jgi:serine/threonine protein kinase
MAAKGSQEKELDVRVNEALNIALKGKYDRKMAVGRGAYGEVWLCTRVSDGCQCVAKVMSMDKMHRYESEVHCLTSCDHFAIVKLFDTVKATIGPIIILDYADGGDLSKSLKGHVASQANAPLLTEAYIAPIFLQLLLSLHHIHVRRMMHRDIKSANVLLCSNGLIKMSDFGFSRQFDGTVSQDVADTFLGTPYYLAPELWKRQKYSKKADVWSLGVLLYELMTLKRPFVSSSMRGLMTAIIKGECESPSTSQYSSGLREVLNAMLAVDTTKRPSTADLLQRPIMKQYVEQFLADVAKNTKLSAKEKETIMTTVKEQMADSSSAKTIAAVTAEDEEEPQERIVMEGPVQIGSVKEWKQRYIVLNEQALIVTRVKEDRRSQQLPITTIVNVTAADPATGGDSVLIVALETGYTVWIKAASDAERDTWIEKIKTSKDFKASK